MQIAPTVGVQQVRFSAPHEMKLPYRLRTTTKCMSISAAEHWQQSRARSRSATALSSRRRVSTLDVTAASTTTRGAHNLTHIRDRQRNVATASHATGRNTQGCRHKHTKTSKRRRTLGQLRLRSTAAASAVAAALNALRDHRLSLRAAAAPAARLAPADSSCRRRCGCDGGRLLGGLFRVQALRRRCGRWCWRRGNLRRLQQRHQLRRGGDGRQPPCDA